MLSVMSRLTLLIALLCTSLPSLAMKNRRQTFPQSCDVVWKAAVAVAKSQDYRIISIAAEEQVLSLSAGGIWWGERIISLSLAPGIEHGCTATVQSRYSGLQHSDGPDLLARIDVQLIGEEVDRDSKAFRNFKNCIGSYNHDETKCVEKLKKAIAESARNAPVRPDPPLWNKQSQ
jgi:hypothetical protein